MSVHSQTVPMRTFWLFFLVLLFVHQDFWNWSDESLVGLGMPIGLFYHALFSLACSALGVWAVTRAWPTEWEKYAEEKSPPSTKSNQIRKGDSEQ
ncbi:hypothetical protein N9N55_01960 [Opitutales bacterium]|nr:hypothetical protein [Opitutales bacterium]MDA8988885.1 hypothetical protein [Opitutales bacterium]MDB3958464.1 hypothetical protein [Opitutales bacterium]